MQTAIIGRLLLIDPRKFYPPLLLGTVLGCFVSMGIALGIFKLLLDLVKKSYLVTITGHGAFSTTP